MTDKLDTAVSNVIGATNDNKNLLNPSLGQQDKADPLDIAVNTAITDYDKKLTDEAFKDSSIAKNTTSDLTDEQQKQIADYARQESVKGKINLLAKVGKTPDEMASKVQAARMLGLPENSLIDLSPETEKEVNEALTRNNIKYNPALDTPITESLLGSGVDGTMARDSLVEIQAIEYRMRRNAEKKRAEKEAAQQSRGLLDNFRYGQSQLGNLMIAGSFWAFDNLDSNPNNIKQRNQKLISLALETEDMPHDLRMAKIGETYDDKGAGAALAYTITNPSIATSLLSQSLSSLALGGPIGKVATTPVKIAAEKYVASQILKSYLVKAGTLGAIGATSTAGMAYSPNVARAYEKTGEAASALDRAKTQTSVDSAFGFAGGMLPLPTMLTKRLGGRIGNVLNVTSEATAQATGGVGGTYYSAKAVGEEVTGGELFTNFIMGYVTAPTDIAMASLTGGKQFRESFFSDARTVDDVVKAATDMRLSRRDPEKAKEIIKRITEQSDENLKDVFIPVEEFTRYFQEQGIDPADLADKVTGKQGALEEALTTGTDLQIPLEAYAVDIAANGHEKAFSEIVRTAPDALNAKELSEIEAKLKETTDELVKQADETIKKETAFLEDKTVYNNVFEQLKKSGTDNAAAEKQALIHQAFFNTLGQRLGVDPVSIFDKYSLKIGMDFNIGQDSLKSFSDTKANGFIDIAKDGSVRINLTEKKNLSTFLHESGHFFLNVLGDVESNKPDLAEMNNALKSWLKTDDLKNLTTEQHEKFARGFEAYLMEGKAPSLDLKGAFDRFKAWLTQVYRVVKNLDVKLSDDVRQVFDRMLATDDAIEVARAPYREVFSTAEQAGMSQKEFDVYKETASKANLEAKEQLLAQSLRELSREKTKEYREAKKEIKEQVTNDLQNEPIYVLDDFLRRGIDNNGQHSLEIQKLDADLVKSVYGEETAKQLKRFTQKDGLHPDIVSGMFGFDSTDTMIQQLASKPTNDAMINAETKARLIDRFGDTLLDGTITEKAIKAVEGDGRAKVLEAELKAINKQRKIADRVARIKVNETNKAHKEAEAQARKEHREADKADKQVKRDAFDNIASERLLREASRELISTSIVKDIKPHLYLNAERKANKQSFEAVQKGDWEAAAKAKEQERLNHFLFREAVKAQEVSNKIFKYANSFEKKTKRERINKANKDGLEQIDSILEQYEFKQVSNKQLDRRQSLRNYLDDLASYGIEPDMPEFVIDNARQVNFKEISFEQLQAVNDSLKAIETVAQLKNKLISGQKQRDFTEFKEEALKSLNDNIPVDAKAKATSRLSETATDRALHILNKGGNVNIANLITLCYRADGGRADGVISSAVYRPIAEAEVKMKTMMRDAAQQLNKILSDKYGDHLKEKKVIKSLGGHMIAKGEAIMMALNTGNQSNKSRLLTGGIKTQGSVKALPLSEQSIAEVLSTLTKQDWDFVQGVWKLFDDMKPELKEMYRTLNGTELKEIEAGTIKTNFGEIKGGYFPLVYDHDVAAVPDGVLKKSIFNESYQSAMPSNGYTKARAEKVTGTVNLEINMLPSKLSEHILDLTHRKALIDANKILTDPEISAALKQKLGVDSYNTLYKSIYDIANVSPDKGIGAWFSALTQNAATYYLGASLQTMINQIPGAFELLNYVKPAEYVREIVSTIGNYENNLKFIRDNSPLMADRWQKMNFSKGLYEKLKGKGKLAVTHENIKTIALAFMPVFERVFSTPAWMAIYKREMASGNAHEKAVMQADAAIIKSQGGFLNIDKNNYQKNKAIAPFYVFASPFIASHNANIDAVFLAKQGKASYTKAIMKRLSIIALASFGYSLAAGQKKKDDDYSDFMIESFLSYTTAGIPFVRDGVNLAVGGYGRSAMSTPAASTVGNAIQEIKRVGNPDSIKADRTIAALAAITGTPLKPITVQGAAIKDMVTGDYKPDGTLDAVRHLLYRKNKPK